MQNHSTGDELVQAQKFQNFKLLLNKQLQKLKLCKNRNEGVPRFKQEYNSTKNG